MTTLNTNTDMTEKKITTDSTPAQAVVQNAETAAVITEQQVLFASASALAPTLAPAPARHRNVAYGFASAVRAMFVRPEKPHARKHYPQRFLYLENSAMSRAMDRL